MSVVGEGLHGSVGGEDQGPEVELGFFALGTLVGTFLSQWDAPALLVPCTVTSRASENMEIVGL